MGPQKKKFWKPPSFEDFTSTAPTKKIKLDHDEFVEEKPHVIPTELAEPRNVEELAIHPRKIEEVRHWIKCNKRGKCRILLVTGPTGSGKTATIKASANAERVKVKEWINPIDKSLYKEEPVFQTQLYDRFNFFETNQTDKFEEFVFRSSRYNSLFEETIDTVILVEDLPNIFIWRPKLFHEFLEKYQMLGKSPIVFVVTDDQNLNLHNDLFPNHVKSRFNIANIKFNPVNNSSLVRNLKNVADYYCPEKVSPQFIETICKNSGGDLRSATNDLLLLLRTDLQSQGAKKPKKRLKKDEGLWVDGNPSSSKDPSIDFYHVMGRILYPKLVTDDEKLKNPNRLFVHDVHEIAEHWSHSFLGVLHENYLQTFGKFKDVVGGAECFSFCDVLGRYEELQEYSSLFGVISLMSRNTQPKKSGFNPLKKSVRVDSNKFGRDLESNVALSNCESSERNMLLDVVPFLKIIRQSEELGSQSDVKMEGVDLESGDDEIEIEEFDD